MQTNSCEVEENKEKKAALNSWACSVSQSPPWLSVLPLLETGI